MLRNVSIPVADAAKALVSVMAADDLREPDNFLTWLVFREAQRRGLLPTTDRDPAIPIQPYQEVADAA